MKIIAYPNCSKGGVSTVIRNRALADPGTQFFAIFSNDKGGRGTFGDLENVRVEVVDINRMARYIRYVLRQFDVEQVSILNLPEVANEIAVDCGERLIYEFHSSDVPWIKREIDQLDHNAVRKFAVPSEQMHGVLVKELAPEVGAQLYVLPNELGSEVFSPEGGSADISKIFDTTQKILVWVGRIEWKKGDVDFLRLLRLLPSHFVGVMIISLENDPQKVGALLREALEIGVADRVHLLMDLNQQEVASIFRAARDSGGWFVSTSYIESFGYAVREALSCNLRTAAYEPEIPVWADLRGRADTEFVSIGDIRAMANAIQ